MSRFCSQDATLYVNKDRIAIEHVDLRFGLIGLRDYAESAWEVVFIGIQPANNVTGCHTEPFIECIRLTSVLFGNPTQMRVALQDLQCVIGRACVNDDVFKVGIILALYATNCIFDESSHIQARGYDSYSWIFVHIRRYSLADLEWELHLDARQGQTGSTSRRACVSYPLCSNRINSPFVRYIIPSRP